MRLLFLVFFFSLCCFAFGETNSSEQFKKVTVQPGDTLWAIANTYLKNPKNWDQILKYNTLPSSDPTIALPGMILKVPIKIMKEKRQAGKLISTINQVLLRRQETAKWKKTSRGESLYAEDTLRTLDASKARVRFLNAELLDLEPNSMAVIMLPPNKKKESVSLKSGSLFINQAQVITAAATITPKVPHTIYSAKIKEDASTVVRVYSGIASVKSQGQNIDLSEGMETTVPPGLAPGFPRKIPHWNEFKAQAEMAMNIQKKGISQAQTRSGESGSSEMTGTRYGANAANTPASAGGAKIKNASGGIPPSATANDSLQAEISNLSIGNPISGYRAQISISRDFSAPIFDNIFDSDEKLDIQAIGLKPGLYWIRLATIDLLGTQGPFTQPRQYAVVP